MVSTWVADHDWKAHVAQLAVGGIAFTHIERWENGAWVRKWEEQDRMLCEEGLKIQAACSRRIGGFSLPPSLLPGKYRLAHYETNALLWESNTFTITAADPSSLGASTSDPDDRRAKEAETLAVVEGYVLRAAESDPAKIQVIEQDSGETVFQVVLEAAPDPDAIEIYGKYWVFHSKVPDCSSRP